MSRIQKAYETRFLWLLRQAGARRPQEGVEWFLRKARRVSSAARIPFAHALTRTYEDAAARLPFRRVTAPAHGSLRFFCDAGLGGLARWLRAAGYETEWEAGIDDDELLCRARALPAAILTTDSMLMERRVLRDRVIPSFWLPPTLSIMRQLELVFREFGLEARAPRCMSCGGELRRGDKEELKQRIPPRTYRWLDEYFVCTRCGKLFWHGTHWQRIVRALEKLKVSTGAP